MRLLVFVDLGWRTPSGGAGWRGGRAVETFCTPPAYRGWPLTGPTVFKTILILGFLALAGLLALKLLLAILGAAVGLAFGLVALAVPALMLGALIYAVLVVFAPERAAALRARFGA